MKFSLVVVVAALSLAAAQALPVADGTSPDGRITVSLEKNSIGQQILAVQQPGGSPGASQVNTGRPDEAVGPADAPRVEWNTLSTFFLFTFHREGKLTGQIVALPPAGGTGVHTTYLNDMAGADQVVSCQIVSPTQLRLVAVSPTGQIQYTLTVQPDGTVKAEAFRPQ